MTDIISPVRFFNLVKFLQPCKNTLIMYEIINFARFLKTTQIWSTLSDFFSPVKTTLPWQKSSTLSNIFNTYRLSVTFLSPFKFLQHCIVSTTLSGLFKSSRSLQLCQISFNFSDFFTPVRYLQPCQIFSPCHIFVAM